jgi:arylsulfatase
MEVYAAQIDRMDQGIGRILAALEKNGQLANTVVIFLADNGACAEDIPEGVTIDELVNKLMIAKSHTRTGEPVHFGNDPGRMPGPENTYQSYGTAWANLSNTPFRLYKHWIHEGGISTPLIVHWPEGITDKGAIRHAPGYLPDIMATILDVTGTPYPQALDGQPIEPLEGQSLAPVFQRDGLERPPMFWEHEGNAAVRIGKWKLVRNYPAAWELYDMEADRTELHDLAAAQPERVADMARQYEAWAQRCGVIDREKIIALMASQGVTRAFWEKPQT